MHQKFKSVARLTMTAVLVLFFGVLIAHGGWVPNPGNPPQLNPDEPIHVGNGQIKSGGLFLNWDQSSSTAGNAASGLIVFGDAPNGSSPGSGLVGIGTSNPTEKLDIAGNFQIDQGILKINGSPGYAWGSVLRKTDTGMQWLNPVEWLTLPGIAEADNSCANPSGSPDDCGVYGFKTFAKSLCLVDQANNFSILVNVCYK